MTTIPQRPVGPRRRKSLISDLRAAAVETAIQLVTVLAMVVFSTWYLRMR